MIFNNIIVISHNLFYNSNETALLFNKNMLFYSLVLLQFQYKQQSNYNTIYIDYWASICYNKSNYCKEVQNEL